MLKIQAVIFDWAGTIIDYGSRAPVAALQQAFAEAGIPITVAEARISMGIAKKDHIQSILSLPRVAGAWKQARGAAHNHSDLDALYAAFLPKQLDCLADFSRIVAGVPSTAEGLHSRGIKIGSTTGYTRPMLDFLVTKAREQGFTPDCSICPQDVPGGGRPAPWMCYANAIQLQASPLWRMVKIGDTPSDIEEGLNAGMWTIGVTRTGNEAGLTEEEWNSLEEPERRQTIQRAGERLSKAGAHYLVESAGDCLDVIDEIQGLISFDERPS